MSVWIEIHCDVNHWGPENWNHTSINAFCYTHNNNNVMGGSPNGRAHINKTLARLEREAKQQGWVRTRKGWACPNCKTTL